MLQHPFNISFVLCVTGDYQETAKSRRVAEFVGGLYGDYRADNLKKAMKGFVKEVYFSPTKIMLDDSRELKIKINNGTKSETK